MTDPAIPVKRPKKNEEIEIGIGTGVGLDLNTEPLMSRQGTQSAHILEWGREFGLKYNTRPHNIA